MMRIACKLELNALIYFGGVASIGDNFRAYNQWYGKEKKSCRKIFELHKDSHKWELTAYEEEDHHTSGPKIGNPMIRGKNSHSDLDK